MKKFTISIIIIFSLAAFLFYPKKAQADTWNDCPFGKVNDEYPGDCARYIDTDNDGICDHSQLSPEEKERQKENSELISDTNQSGNSASQKQNYYIGFIFFLLSGLYVLTYIFSKKKFISQFTHKKIWNVLLLLVFGVNLASSLLLVLQLAYEVKLDLPFNLSFWHIESGIVFTLIAIFHIWWHIPYYRQIFKK